MNQVKLMNRIDKKYWFHNENLQGILQSVNQHYYILDIEGQNEFLYTSTYYDTMNNRMYMKHHNGNLNRYKIRRRNYISSELSFLEIKFKNNKGRTIKKRIPADYRDSSFTIEEREFIRTHTPYSCNDLKPSLINEFSRRTLVNKNFKERCTIDQNLQYTVGGKGVTLENLIIIEIKSEGNSSISPLTLALREEHIRVSGFSKYCVGRAITAQNLKKNAFKGKIRRIEKIIHTNIDLYNKS